MTNKRKIAEIFGWYGAVAIVSAYALVSFDVISPDGWLFQVLNLTGALGIIVISSLKKVRQSIVLNAFWAAIAVLALVRMVAS
jgi:hypothetical protein